MILGFVKYKVGALATFILVLLVLAFSSVYYHFSSRILHLTTSSDIAERQKTLVQQLAKNLLAVEKGKALGVIPPEIFVELEDHYTLFNKTIIAFSVGGPSSNLLGEPFRVEPITDVKGLESLARAMDIWIPYQEHVENIVTEGELIKDLTLNRALKFSAANEAKLLDLMDVLTQSLALESTAAGKMQQKLQITGLAFTVILFLGFVNYVGFRLKRYEDRADQSSSKLAAVQKEIKCFLRQCQGAVFSLTYEGIIRGENIASLEHLLHKKELEGKHLLDVLSSSSNIESKTLTDYLDLLFDEYADNKVVDSKNPLQHIKIASKSRRGRTLIRHLSFEFSSLNKTKTRRSSSVLVIVKDITNDYVLTEQLREALYHSKLATNMLAGLSYDDTELEKFFTTATARMLELKNRLFCLEYTGADNSVYEPMYKLLEILIQDATRLHQPLFIDAVKSLYGKLEHLAQAETKENYDASLQECQIACSELDYALNESRSMFKKCADGVPNTDKRSQVQAKAQCG